MASSTNPILQLLITAKDEASGVFSKVFKALNDNTNVIAGKVREAFTGLFNITDESQAFEAQLARVQSKSNASAAEMAKLKQAALEMGRQMGVSAVVAAQGLEILTGAGLTVDQAISALGPTLRVMQTEQVGAAEAAGALTDALALMGISLDQAARAGDVMQAGADATSTSVMEMAEAMRGAGAAASGAGLTLEQTVTILTSFAKYGLKGSEAGTSLANMLNLLNDPTSKARVELAKLGQTSGDVAEMIGTLTKAGPRGSAAMLAFGQAQGGVNALLKTGVQGFAEYGAAIEASGGGLKKAADTIGNTTVGALSNLTAAWQQVKLALTGPLLEPIAKGAQELATRLGELANSGYLEKIGKGIAAVFVQGGQQVADFLKTVNWEQLQTDATAALASLRTTINAFVTEVKANAQGISDWGAVAFAPITTAIDGMKLSFAAGKGDTEAMNAALTRMEERAAAVGRALTGTSGDLVRHAAATRDLTTAGEAAAQAIQRQTAATEESQREIEAMTAALKEGGLSAEVAASYTERLRLAKEALAKATGQATTATAASVAETEKATQATTDLTNAGTQAKPGIEAYTALWQKNAAGAMQLVEAHGKLGAGTAEVTRVIGESGVGMKDWNGTLVKSNEGVTALWDGLTKFAPTVRSTSEVMGEYSRRIAYANDMAAGWSSGMELNGVKMIGLRDAATATAEKLAYLQSIQATLPDADRQIAAAKQAATQAQNQYNTALSEHIAQLEAKQAAIQRSNTIEQKGYDLLISQAKAEEEIATLKGDTTAATRAQTDATELQNQKAAAAIAKKNEEIALYPDIIAAKKRELEADGSLNEADQAQLATMADTLTGMGQERDSMAQTLQATKDLTEAKKAKKEADEAAAKAAKEEAEAEKEHAEQVEALGNAMEAVYNGWAQRLNELSPAARAAFDGFTQGADVANASIEELKEKASKNMAEMSQVIIRSGIDGFAAWAASVAKKALDIERAFLSQKIAVESAADTLQRFADEGGNVAEIERLIAQYGEGANVELGLLDEQDLNNLRSAIDSANDKLREMQQETEDAQLALAEMNAELLAEQGNTAGADRLKLQIEKSQRLAELERKRMEAEATGNKAAAADYARMIGLLDDVIAAKSRALEQDIKTRQEQERTAKTQTSGGSNEGSSSKGGSGAEKTYNLNLTAGGKTLTATTATDPSGWLTDLEKAKVVAG